jgi:voltage-gated potassium channel Kch
LFAFGLAQGGEFAFVLFSYALQNGVLTSDVTNPLIAAVAISMALTPLLMLINEKLIQPNFGTKESVEKESDAIDEKNEVIIAGFGRYGSTIGRFLQANGMQATYLDIDSNNVDLLRKLGLKVFYGDASRHDLLHAAGAEDAKLLIVSVDDSEKSLEIVETAQKHFPHLKIMVRTKYWNDYYTMLDKDVLGVYREFSDVALRIGAEALGHMGYRKNQVQKALMKFRRLEEENLKELATSRHEQKNFIKQGRRVIQELELLIREEIENEAADKDLGWDTESIIEEFSPILQKMKEEERKSS